MPLYKSIANSTILVLCRSSPTTYTLGSTLYAPSLNKFNHNTLHIQFKLTHDNYKRTFPTNIKLNFVLVFMDSMPFTVISTSSNFALPPSSVSSATTTTCTATLPPSQQSFPPLSSSSSTTLPSSASKCCRHVSTFPAIFCRP